MRDRTLWILQVAAGGVVLVLLALHMGTMHLDATLDVLNPAQARPVAWENVAARGRGVAFLAGYVLLLGAALLHGLLGLRGLLLELAPAAGVRRTLAALLTGLGLGLFALGTWAAWAAFRLAQVS